MTVKEKTKAPSGPQYKAPALVKGLEIFELLARSSEPITLSGISERLEKSRSQIFRMVQELEATGYIERSKVGEGYEITNKLFLLGFEQPRSVTLLEAALPKMRAFSQAYEQSCHLAIRSGELIVVIARIESPGPVSFTVRLGHRQLISQSTSGVILFTWQRPDEQECWLTTLRDIDQEFDEALFFKQVKGCQKTGYLKKDSRFIRGVTDIAAPIMRDGEAIASLTAPCISRLDHTDLSAPPVDALVETAKQISAELG